MKRILFGLSLAAGIVLLAGFRQATEKDGAATRLTTPELAGRWDLTLQARGETYPSWIEINAGSTPSVRIVSRTGSVHPASDVKIEGSHITFSEANGRGKW